MFKKKVVEFKGNKEHFVTKHETNGFKKNQQVDVPKGYEVVLIEADGTTEIIKNQYSFKLPTPCQYIFYVKSNSRVIKTNWGTSSRIPLKNQNGDTVTVGGYGTVEFQMMNPIRLINYRLNNDDYVDEEILTDILLSKLPEVLHNVGGELSPIDDQDTVKLERLFKEKTLQALSQTANLMGLEVVDFVIENINISE